MPWYRPHSSTQDERRESPEQWAMPKNGKTAIRDEAGSAAGTETVALLHQMLGFTTLWELKTESGIDSLSH